MTGKPAYVNLSDYPQQLACGRMLAPIGRDPHAESVNVDPKHPNDKRLIDEGIIAQKEEK